MNKVINAFLGAFSDAFMGVFLGISFVAPFAWGGERIDYIVKFKSEFGPQTIRNVLPAGSTLESTPLVSDLGLYQIKGQLPDGSFGFQVFNSLKKASGIEYVQPNHKLRMRKTPGDDGYAQQWSLGESAAASIGAPTVWSLTVGGKDFRGSDIVVAVVDGGFDLKHPDLVANIWKNQGEIPGNGIDDDKNGYIDDINGWNAAKKSGKIGVDNHGTHVAGIIGARGDNGIGITGVNWNTQLMFVSVEDASTAEIVTAYGYIIKQKKEWIRSGGKSGANVVVTNSSFGIDGGDCQAEDFPVWNDLFNKLGEVGVLSAVASPNVGSPDPGWDVDRQGDVPSGCDSSYIISVTNVESAGHISYQRKADGSVRKDSSGRPMLSAAVGKTKVDLGSPGEDIYSTVYSEMDWNTGKNSKYAVYSGTSMATPHVAGSIALLYSSASGRFIDDYYLAPAKAALQMKDILLGTVTKDPQLTGLVLTGGRLNLQAASASVSQY